MASHVDPTKLAAARQLLLAAYEANGHIRYPIAARAGELNQSYRKGWEARLGAVDAKAAARLVQAFKRCGYTPGNPYQHGTKLRVPLYGFEQVSRFVELVNTK
jgi:hypothetical protein